MTMHPLVPFDQSVLDEVASRLDLRAPNAEALEAVAKEFDSASGEPFEAVCDLATAVGKTYLAAGLIEYLANSGVRHVVIITPGRTILDKTVNNFTVGHPKSVLGGMECEPLVITAENFATGSVASALDDEDRVKLFVFTVQQLIRPSDKMGRRTRKHQEWLGTDLYEHLRGVDDLVVLADECHVYTEKAKSFHAAVRDLDAMATIGLTATPSKSDAERVVYHYPLARAIADRYVKTPVLVGRRDDATDVETRLRDGLALLDAKQQAADTYAAATGAAHVNAVMFVVADTIDNANAVAEILRKPGLLGDSYEQSVLVVHSDSPDDALLRLASVEEPDSPVRVIVSVSMLKEGWDVKNIFVICSLRPSISDVLTEQTLGRGLRLPWGSYTGVELLDTVEVVSHERYGQLLERAGVLLEGLVETRRTSPQPAPDRGTASSDAPAPPTVPGQSGDSAGLEESSPADDGSPTHAPADGEVGDRRPALTGVAGEAPHEPSVASTEERLADARIQAATAQPVEPSRSISMPDVEVTFTPRRFELSEVDESRFTDLGRQLAQATGGTLERKVLDVVADPSAAAGYRMVPREASEEVLAASPQLPLGGAAKALQEAILALDIVPETRTSARGAKELAAAVVAGAGSEELLGAYLNAAVNASRRIINETYRSKPEDRQLQVLAVDFAPTRVNTRTVEPNRFGPFDRQAAYSGWSRSQHPLQWFDTAPERTLANLLDADSSVAVWARIQRGELVVRWEDGSYSPDLYAEVDGSHYLFEVKADRDVGRDDVVRKAAAAREWARQVTYEGDHGTWRYLLVSESDLKTAKTLTSVIGQASSRS